MAKKKENKHLSIPMAVHKYPNLKELRSQVSQHWKIDNIQPFFPPIEKMFKTDIINNSWEYGIKFSKPMLSTADGTFVKTSEGDMEVHKKISMILSSFRLMQGDYGGPMGLPRTQEHSELITQKVQSHNNAAYVGAIISASLNQSGCQHFPEIHGIFSGMSKNHEIDISDDYEELIERSWFSSAVGNTFNIRLRDGISPSGFVHTRKRKHQVLLGDETELDDVVDLDFENLTLNEPDIKQIAHGDDDSDDDESDSSSVSTSYIFAVRSCDCSEIDSDDGEEEESEPFAWASFTNVPVQITVMEKFEGTIYSLFKLYPDSAKWMDWISQVIFALAYAQKNFSFVHNDLHANNIMFKKTGKEYFYYSMEGVLYRVPTHGYIIKLIDFERSIASIRIQGMRETKTFISDQFDIDEEAGGQYNMEPFLTKGQPEIRPNMSFDLVRLATSLFWDLYPDGPDQECSDRLFILMKEWMTTTDGKSVLFSEVSKHDRFHGFHLYKAIVRFCSGGIPKKEIPKLKDLYFIEKVPAGESVCAIDF